MLVLSYKYFIIFINTVFQEMIHFPLELQPTMYPSDFIYKELFVQQKYIYPKCKTWKQHNKN